MYDFNNKCVLITGGAGFIGSNLAHYISKNYKNTKVIVFDIFRTGERFDNGNLKSFGHYKNLLGFEGEVISGDITSADDLEIIKSIDFDVIFHQAAISDTTVNDQKIMIDTNLNAFSKLLDIAQQKGAVMVYASSGATYGNAPAPQRVGFEEPANIYGFSKLMMDKLLLQRIKEGIDIPVVGLRYFNVYGPREYYKDKTASMVLQFGHQILSQKRPRLFEGSDKIIRDFVYIDDVIQANIKACSAKKSGIYNVGTGVARSFQDIVDILKKELNSSLECEYIPNPHIGQYQFHTQADIDSTRAYLGYEPEVTLEEGIKRYIPEIKRLYEQEVC